MELLDWEWEIVILMVTFRAVTSLVELTHIQVDTEVEFGVVNDFGGLTSDGNFSGIMGLLARDQIDMSGLSMRITPERMQAAHFTFPTRYFQQVYIINDPPENDFRNFIFATFTTQVWLMLLVTILGVAMLRFVIAILIEQRTSPSTNILTGSILETYGLMLKQRVIDPTAGSAMVLEAVLIAAMLVVSQYYVSSMNSKLTAPPTSAIPFLHQDELLTLLEQKKRYLTYYADIELEGCSEKNVERIKKVMKYNPVVTHENENDLVAEIKRGGVFYSVYDIEFLPQAVSVWDRNQGLTVIRDTTGIVSYAAFAFSSDNRGLRTLFNRALLEVLPGIPQITLGHDYAHKKEALDTTVQAKRTTLSLKSHLEQLFLIYIIFSFACIVTFLVEIIVFHAKQHVSRKAYVIQRRQCVSNSSVFFVRVSEL
ncbi:hypothetical protein Y032_0282g1286 [Ancylostoma ceylanicum]|nr:hypothetical protein Y032_0282g1286 [Ancylostoma ceylanicum]